MNLLSCLHALKKPIYLVTARLAKQPIHVHKLPGLTDLRKMKNFNMTLALESRPNVVPPGIGKPFFIPFKVVR
jgi:hypothetical protein